jgi:probable addiction module antidote protein
MTSRTRPYREMLLDALADPSEAAHYLNAAIEDSQESFLKALKNVAQAHQMAKVARNAGVQRETLYRSLSSEGNPTLDTLSSILNAVGLKIVIGAKDDGSTPCTMSGQQAASLIVDSDVVVNRVEVHPLIYSAPYAVSGTSTGAPAHVNQLTVCDNAVFQLYQGEINAPLVSFAMPPFVATQTQHGISILHYEGSPQSSLPITVFSYTGSTHVTGTFSSGSTGETLCLNVEPQAGYVQLGDLAASNARIGGLAAVNFDYVGIGPTPFWAALGSCQPKTNRELQGEACAF